jgi:hypothetical protein
VSASAKGLLPSVRNALGPSLELEFYYNDDSIDYSWRNQRRIKMRRSPTAAEDLVYNGARDPECRALESLSYAVYARAGILPVLAPPSRR